MVGMPSVPTPSGAARRAGAVKDAEGTAERRTPRRASLTAPSTVAAQSVALGLEGGGDPPSVLAAQVVHRAKRPAIGESIGLTIGTICARPSARAGRDQVLVLGATKCSWISRVVPSLWTGYRYSARHDPGSNRGTRMVQQKSFLSILHSGARIDRQHPT